MRWTGPLESAAPASSVQTPVSSISAATQVVTLSTSTAPARTSSEGAVVSTVRQCAGRRARWVATRAAHSASPGNGGEVAR